MHYLDINYNTTTATFKQAAVDSFSTFFLFFACAVFQTDLSRRVSIATLFLVYSCYYDFTKIIKIIGFHHAIADNKKKKRIPLQWGESF